MHRIDSDGSIAGAWSNGNPGTGTLGTKVDEAWMNGLQENICGFIEAAGIALVKGDHTQLRDAVDAFIATHNGVTNPHSATSAATASRLVIRDANGRAQFADPASAQDAVTKAFMGGARVFAAYACQANASVIHGAGAGTSSISHGSPGVYAFDFSTQPSPYGVAVASITGNTAGFATTELTGPSQITVRTFTAAGALADLPFTLAVFNDA